MPKEDRIASRRIAMYNNPSTCAGAASSSQHDSRWCGARLKKEVQTSSVECQP